MDKIIKILDILKQFDCDTKKIESNSFNNNLPNFEELQYKLTSILEELKNLNQIERDKKIELLIQFRILIIQYLEFFETTYEKVTTIISKI